MPAGDACGLNGKPSLQKPDPMGIHPLRPILEQVDASSCPGRFNFHCHTIHSDGSLRPEPLGQQALALGLEHLAVTDHHSTEAYVPLKTWFRQQADQGQPVPELWTGVEISCLLESCLVHVLALGFAPGDPALDPYRQGAAPVGEALQASTVVDRIHDAGGLALLAHPGRYRLSFQRLIPAAAALGFDGAEAYYDYAMQPRWEPTPHVCDAIARLLDVHALLRSCGTDTHGLELSGR